MKIYNTQSKSLEEFIPITKNEIKMYVCGPTVYDLIHIGNARPIIFFDVVARYFKSRGYTVYYVQNFTDVDDKIIERAKNEGSDALSLSKKYIEEFYKDIEKLNLTSVIRPKVSENMSEIVSMIQTLVDSKYAYVSNNDVYFNISKYKNYGTISNQNISSLIKNNRIDENEKKENALDFALWKSQKEGEIFWSSPFGNGRPGWHIECSALIKKYLCDIIDIHGGGIDLTFPHHENENAQSTCACQKDKLANFWMHNGFININNEKMSKSLKNFKYLRDFLSEYSPDIIRLFMLTTHYRKPINYSSEDILATKKTYNNLLNKYEFIKENIKDNIAEDKKLSLLEKEFIDAMENDFNTSLCIANIYERIKYLEKNLNNLSHFKKLEFDIKEILGLTLIREDMNNKELVDLLVELREKARLQKDFATADKIRDVLIRAGYSIQDKKNVKEKNESN